jgi:hypothetical protein
MKKKVLISLKHARAASTPDFDDDEDQSALVKADGYDPLLYISFDQQKYIRAVSTSSMSESAVAKAMGIRSGVIKKWEENPHYLAYKHECMSRMHGSEVVDVIQKQQVYLIDKMFQDLMERVDGPTPQEIKEQESWPEHKKEAYAKTLFKNAPAADAVKMYDTLVKNALKIADSNRQTTEKTEFVEEIRTRYFKKSQEDAAWEDAFAKAGIDPMKPFSDQQVIDIGDSKNEEPENKIEVINNSGASVEIMEASIIKRRTTYGNKEKARDSDGGFDDEE